MFGAGIPSNGDILLSRKSDAAIATQRLHLKYDMYYPNTPGSKDTLITPKGATQGSVGLDAVNNDDDSIYDVASTVTFSKMLGQIEYKYTIAPHTNTRFWSSLKTQPNNGLQEPN
ncbi:hypothetical protein MFIFM68171_02280 [Madurella fahalii]|uniref:Uncharacterized protein n=1 Tax=Madurella fahalii TaxID=1157608 RepID=A0ABQ0G2V2_9PEZI